MGFSNDSAEVDEYIGGVFRAADDHPESGPELRGSGIFLELVPLTEPLFPMCRELVAEECASVSS